MRLMYVHIVWNHTSHNEDISIKYTTLTIRIVNIYKHTVFIHIGAYCIQTFAMCIYMHSVYTHAFSIHVSVGACVCTFFSYFTSSTYSITVLPGRMCPHEKGLWYFRALIFRERIQWDCVLVVQTIALVVEEQHLQDTKKESLPTYTGTMEDKLQTARR